jgi:betaine-aldehyde dehydrogenase
VVTGDAEVGEAMVTHPLTDMVTVTGSTATGRRIMSLASGRPARVHLELGGKAPLLVFADADLQAVGQSAALAASYNSVRTTDWSNRSPRRCAPSPSAHPTTVPTSAR